MAQARGEQGQVRVGGRPLAPGKERREQAREVRDEDDGRGRRLRGRRRRGPLVLLLAVLNLGSGRRRHTAPRGRRRRPAPPVQLGQDLPQAVHVKHAREHDAVQARPHARLDVPRGHALVGQLGRDAVPQRPQNDARRLGRDDQRPLLAGLEQRPGKDLQAELHFWPCQQRRETTRRGEQGPGGKHTATPKDSSSALKPTTCPLSRPPSRT